MGGTKNINVLGSDGTIRGMCAPYERGCRETDRGHGPPLLAHGKRYGDVCQPARALLGHNPAVDAVIAKIDFLARQGRGLQRSAYIQLCLPDDAYCLAPVFPSGDHVRPYRLSTLATADFRVYDSDWLVPAVVNAGGFDAVQYRRVSGGTLKFVTVTRNPQVHTFQVRWFVQFRAAFVAKFADCAVAACEVWCVVEWEHLVGFVRPHQRARWLGLMVSSRSQRCSAQEASKGGCDAEEV
jgi:hypothetical protein